MLDITLESPTDRQGAADFSLQRSPTARSPGDRRAGVAAKSPDSTATPKRRRHDNLHTGKHVPLEW
jgi:hypothetical protein